jgi:DNA polymerase-1
MTLGDLQELVCLDFEYRSTPGERTHPVCFVAHELRSGRIYRGWTNEGYACRPPYAAGTGVAVICYQSGAELSCYRQLGWPYPHRILDLYIEFRRRTNGLVRAKLQPSLIDALKFFRLRHMAEADKALYRDLVLKQTSYTVDEQREILRYCEADVTSTAALFRRLLAPDAEIGYALLSAEFQKVLADCEYIGVPIDQELWSRIREHWESLKEKAAARCNQTIPVFDGLSLRTHLLKEYLAQQRLLAHWPKSAKTGKPSMETDVLKTKVAQYPYLEPLADAWKIVNQLRKLKLAVGRDGRNRASLTPVGTVTGRVTASTVEYIFFCPSFLRGLIRPEPGTGLAYVDLSQCEVGIAGQISGDDALRSAYSSDDTYMTFARQAAIVPAHATKSSHPRERELCKQTVLSL